VPLAEIVLVEDCDDHALLLTRVLARLGVINPVRHFTSGSEALKYLESATTPPTVILVDIGLPDVSGFDVLKRLKTFPRLASALRIGISHNEDPAVFAQAVESGAHSFLSKALEHSEIRGLFAAYPTHWMLERGSQASASVAPARKAN